MNTTSIFKSELRIMDFSTNLMRAIALHTFNGGDYFIVKEGDSFVVYEGNEQEHAAEFSTIAASDAEYDFSTYCAENCTEIEELAADDERDGYICLTDEEADEKAKENILDSVWAFNPSFLSSFTGFDIEVFEAIANNGRCESNNSAILSMIDDEEDFVAEAIRADGRGHFMNTYDGNENEQKTDVFGDDSYEQFYIYRMN